MTKNLVKSFAQSRRGNFGMMFAITAVPMIAAVGLVVDYSLMSNKQSELQNAVDSAVLLAGNYYWENGTLPSKAYVDSILNSNFDGPSQTVQLYMTENEEIYLEARTNTDGFFLDRFSGAGFLQSADATVPVAQEHDIEIALVLDTTGSMAVDGKMVALKTVATDFVTQILNFAPPGDPDAVKIGLVPFADYVNVGVSRRSEPWMDVPADIVNTTCSMQRDLISKSGCSTTTTNHPRTWVPASCWPASYSDGVQTSPAGCSDGYWRDAYTSSSETCTNYEYGPDYEVCNTTVTTWHGCVGSRAPALNVRDQAFSVRVPGLLGLICTAEVEPLTNNQSVLTSKINSFGTARETYIGTGVSWGYRMLSRKAPFTEGNPYGDETKKFLIVMSDGDNTRAPEIGGDKKFHTNGDTSYGNSQTAKACKEARDEDIIIYSIAFGTTITADGKATLEDCAGVPTQYFVASDAAALKRAFDTIAREIFQLKLTS